MAAEDRWYFSKEQLLNSPSRKAGYDPDRELSCRQQAANFIQDMGQRLSVSQLCINTAIVYMHRFYVFHSLGSFHRNSIAAAALFLAAKVEEQPRKLEHVIRVAHLCLHRDNPNIDSKSEQYLEQAQDLVFNENVLLQTLGFDVAIDHPHTHVVRCCDLVRASKDLAQTSYFMASNSLHLTTMCLLYKPTVVACFCIHLACKWSNWEIPKSSEGKDWFWYVDKTVTLELLEQLTSEFLAIFDKCPTKLKKKMTSMNQSNSPGFTQAITNEGIHFDDKKVSQHDGLFQKPTQTTDKGLGHHHHQQQQKIEYREYKEKKEREKLEKERLEKERQDKERQMFREVPPTTHHPSKIQPGGPKPQHSSMPPRPSVPNPNMQKNYQPTHGQPPHFPRDSSSHYMSSNQNYTSSSSSSKDNSSSNKHSTQESREREMGQVKERDNFMPPYMSNSNTQSSNFQSSSSHHDAKNRNYSNPYGNSHHSQQREYQTSNQREHDSHSNKDVSGIRDIISSASQVDKKDQLREKQRMQYPFNNKLPRDHTKNYPQPDLFDRKDLDPAKQVNNEYGRDSAPVKQVKNEFGRGLDPTKSTKNEFNRNVDRSMDNIFKWNQDSASETEVKKEFVKVDNLVKFEPKEVKLEQKNDYYSGSKSPTFKNLPSSHSSSKNYQDPKYKSHHQHQQNPYIKHDKIATSIKPNEKHRRPTDSNPNQLGPSNTELKDKSRTDKLFIKDAKDNHEKHRHNMPIIEDFKRNKVPPPHQPVLPKSKIKPESQNRDQQIKSLPKLINSDENNSKPLTLPTGIQKQWNHEFGVPSSMLMSTAKTASIFSPDSKIPPQSILSSLEKESKKSPDHNIPSPNDSSHKNMKKSLIKTSLFSPPLPKITPQPAPTNQRNRTSSSGSEPELIPVITKLEDTPGYENIIREKKIALTPSKDSDSPNGDRIIKEDDNDQKPLSKPNKMENESNKSKLLDNSELLFSKSYYPNKYSGEICSEVGAVIFPPAQKKPTFAPTVSASNATTVTTSTTPSDSNFNLVGANLTTSTSTVNLSGIEKMVDTSITPSKQSTSSLTPLIASTVITQQSTPAAVSVESQPPQDKFTSLKNEDNLSKSNSQEQSSHNESHKKSEKKKKKEKHKHKEKDKDKSERKKEKKKHKDKDKERDRHHKEKNKGKDKERKDIDVVNNESPLKITIPKDKIGLSDSSSGLKLKIPKDRFKKDESKEVEPSKCSSSGSLKIKISKEVIGNFSSHREEHKRKRDKSPKQDDLPPSKISKTSDRKSSTKSNGEGSRGSSSSHKSTVS